MEDKVYLGTKLKYAVSLSSPGFDLQRDEFSVDIIRGPKRIHFEKEDLVVDENGKYYVCFDTMELGGGIIEAIITAFVPDEDFDDGIRTEVAKLRLLSASSV